MLIVLAILAWKAWENSQPSKGKAGAGRKEAQSSREGGTLGTAHQYKEEVPYEEPEEEQEEVIEESEHELGEELSLQVDDLHFGLPRCRVRAPGLDPMPQMIRWTPEEFANQQLDIARIHMGSYGVWVVQGMRSNRILYAMKKNQEIPLAQCVVVEGPPPRKMEDDENDNPDTYGSDLAKIQLIP
mmetsp:Transcript_118421/g.230487  ORF Transcript_118421/g.230487 Transcript_118421/m.230487 type:complete len:185 (-) Transcript_118421:85-639(-)